MLRKLTGFIVEKRNLINNFYAKALYLSPGEYAFDGSIKYIMKLEQANTKKASEMLQGNLYRNGFVKRSVNLIKILLFNRKLIIPDHEGCLEEFKGTVYLPAGSSNGYCNVKIFDMERRKVLSILSNPKDYQVVIDNYLYFKPFFPLPNITWMDEDRLLMMEEMVTFHPKKAWVDRDFLLVFEKVAELYQNYFFICKQEGRYNMLTPLDMISSLPQVPEVMDEKNKISPELLVSFMPCLKLHGDLWTANSLLDKENEQIYLIDWEFSHTLLFFYDMMHIMWIEYFTDQNIFYIEKYFNGEYDSYFCSMFANFDLPFNPELRVDYFRIFFLCFYGHRLIHFSAESRSLYLKQYKRLLERFS